MKKLLPIDSVLNDVSNAVQGGVDVILEASPGTGKTTRVPFHIMHSVPGDVLVLEPRRLAAKLSAQRVADENGQQCGDQVGFQVRFESKVSQATRLRYITEGIFLRLLLSNPTLHGVSTVVLDEFHERHIQGDIAFMLVRMLQMGPRPDLRLVIMSATLQSNALQHALPQAKVLTCTIPPFPLEIVHAQEGDTRPFPAQLLQAVASCEKSNDGHVLVFCSGAEEIRQCREILLRNGYDRTLSICELRADSSQSELDKIFSADGPRKIILSTNVAETSLTVNGVRNVIDLGNARVSGFNLWNGMPTLKVQKVSRASCVQRAGRAGRQASGFVYRMYSQFDFGSRPAFEIPEIKRVDLSHTILEISSVVAKLNLQKSLLDLPWFESPLPADVERSVRQLQMLGALDQNSKITELGSKMASYAVHPRIARMLVHAADDASVVLAAAILAEEGIHRRGVEAITHTNSDLVEQCELFLKWKNKAHYPKQLLDDGACFRVERLLQQWKQKLPIQFDERLITKILLLSFPDRVAGVKKSKTQVELNLALGGGALLTKESSVTDAEFLIALEAEEQDRRNSGYTGKVFMAHGLSKLELLDGPDEFITERREVYFDEGPETVRGSIRTMYGGLVLDSQVFTPSSEEIENVLAQALKDRWPKPFEDDEDLVSFRVRCEVAFTQGILKRKIDVDENFDVLLSLIAEGKKSFKEITENELVDYLEQLLDYEEKNLLDKTFPSHLIIGHGRKEKIIYESGKPPYIRTFIQNLFGRKDTPRICNDRVVLNVHLLSPNKQVVSVTSDLSSFWKNHYPATRKELSRKYPRHFWPEDPVTAQPPPPRAGRSKL